MGTIGILARAGSKADRPGSHRARKSGRFRFVRDNHAPLQPAALSYLSPAAILRDDSEAEDVIQDAYVRAYQHLDQFAGCAPFSTWLTRIAVHEALRRLRLRDRSQQLEDTKHDEEDCCRILLVETSLDPEQRASLTELGQLLEEAVLNLPDQYRTVIMLRDIDELSTAETAAVLDLTEQNVKVRLHRGRAMMRDRLFARVAYHYSEIAGIACTTGNHIHVNRCEIFSSNAIFWTTTGPSVRRSS